MKSDCPMFKVDLNEMLDSNLVLLSADDVKLNSLGELVSLHEGMLVTVYMEDTDANGGQDNLFAKGFVTRNFSELAWAANAKWCCRLDSHGIRHESER